MPALNTPWIHPLNHSSVGRPNDDLQAKERTVFMWSQKRRVTGPPVYDVVIVGSGAAGGTAAWVLVQAGLNVAMLDAGPLRKYMEDFVYHDPWPYEDPYRGFNEPLVTPDEFT